MSSLNSYSLASPFDGTIPELIQVISSKRTLGRKGLFIIPYLSGRKVASVTVTCDVQTVPNETQSKWTNPELGFYGYLHARYFKQSIGNPVQINQRNQVLYQWFPRENIVSINERQSYKRLQGLVEFPLVDENAWYLVSPGVTDFTVGLQQDSVVEITVSVGYFDDRLFVFDPYGPPIQNVPDPGQVAGFDPGPYKDLSPEEPPLSPPYRPETGDWGESLPGEPESPPGTGTPFKIRWTARYVSRQTNQEVVFDNFADTRCDVYPEPATVGEPLPDFERYEIYHTITDKYGSRRLRTCPLSTNELEAVEQIDSYEWEQASCTA